LKKGKPPNPMKDKPPGPLKGELRKDPKPLKGM